MKITEKQFAWVWDCFRNGLHIHSEHGLGPKAKLDLFNEIMNQQDGSQPMKFEPKKEITNDGK